MRTPTVNYADTGASGHGDRWTGHWPACAVTSPPCSAVAKGAGGASMFRGRRQDRREERQQEHATFGRGGNATRYQMRQRLASIGDDFNIENDRGERAFQVDGKALRVRKTLLFKDEQGNELCKIQERIARVKDTMAIEGPNGETLATVKKALITPLRERWTVKVGDGPDLDIQ